MTFVASDNEATAQQPGAAGAAATESAKKNEQLAAPGGIIGFSLNYAQQAC